MLHWLNETPESSLNKKMQMLKKIRSWLSVDWSYVTDEINEKCWELDRLCESEQIKLMKKWIKV